MDAFNQKNCHFVLSAFFRTTLPWLALQDIFMQLCYVSMTVFVNKCKFYKVDDISLDRKYSFSLG